MGKSRTSGISKTTSGIGIGGGGGIIGVMGGSGNTAGFTQANPNGLCLFVNMESVVKC